VAAACLEGMVKNMVERAKSTYAVFTQGMLLAASFWMFALTAAAQSSSANYSAFPGLFTTGGGQTNSANFQQNGQWGVWFTKPIGSSANFTSRIKGACGSDNGVTLTIAPVNLCTAGTTGGVVAGNTSYNWSCNGVDGGNPASCSATRNYVVTASVSGGHGSISGSANVAYNTTRAFTLTPDVGYAAGPVTGTCGGNLAGNSFTTNAVVADCTVVATFAVISYTVSFNSNGGSAVASQSIAFNTTAAAPATPTKAGSTFAGWYSDAGLTNAFSFATPITADITLFAKWSVIPTYSVTYSGNGSDGGSVPVDGASYANGATVTVLGNTGNLVRTGFQFAGWNTAADGSGTSYAGGATFAMGLANVSLYARWKALVLDIDGNHSYDALADGLITIRYMFGLIGNPMIAGALGPGASRVDPAQIQQFLDKVKPLMDIDANGQTDALTDGIMILRYLFGLRGSALTNGAIGAGAMRTVPADIEAYIASLMQ